MILVPRRFAEEERARAERATEIAVRNAAWDAYYAAHKACPACGGQGIETTCVGYAEPPDKNRARCGCGWRGIVDDLAPPRGLAAGQGA